MDEISVSGSDDVTVQILLYDGFDELDAIGPYEVFSCAREFTAEPEESGSETAASDQRDDADSRRRIDVRYVTLEPQQRVTASHGTRVEPDGTLPDPTDANAPDILVVPGGRWNARDSEMGAWAEAQRGAVPDALAAYADAGVPIATVCTGSMLLATAEITDGRRAVTHASAIGDLRDSGANVVDARIVDDGDIVTAGGVTSGIDLALYVVEQIGDAALADRIATTLEYDRRIDVAT